MASRESLRLAADGEDPLRDAAMRSTLTYVLIRQDGFVDAERVAVATAEDYQPQDDPSIAQLSVYGGLLLRGATAAAREGRAGAATDLLAEAAVVARRTGVDRTAMTWCSGRAAWSCSLPMSLLWRRTTPGPATAGTEHAASVRLGGHRRRLG